MSSETLVEVDVMRDCSSVQLDSNILVIMTKHWRATLQALSAVCMTKVSHWICQKDDDSCSQCSFIADRNITSCVLWIGNTRTIKVLDLKICCVTWTHKDIQIKNHSFTFECSCLPRWSCDCRSRSLGFNSRFGLNSNIEVSDQKSLITGRSLEVGGFTHLPRTTR